jgi:hypothetical protein
VPRAWGEKLVYHRATLFVQEHSRFHTRRLALPFTFKRLQNMKGNVLLAAWPGNWSACHEAGTQALRFSTREAPSRARGRKPRAISHGGWGTLFLLSSIPAGRLRLTHSANIYLRFHCGSSLSGFIKAVDIHGPGLAMSFSPK